MDPLPLALSAAVAVSEVLALMLITITPWCVPPLMASKAPYSVVNDPVVVPELAVSVTCAPVETEMQSRKTETTDFRKKHFTHSMNA